MTEPERLIKCLAASSKTVAAAESCTAGLVADLLARTPGASQVFWGSFVSYTAAAKITMLGLDQGLVERCGAVSAETALAMARAALERSSADMAVSVTGLAGPLGDGGSAPVGTVWIGTAARGKEPRARKFHYTGSRDEVRMSAALQAVKELLQLFDCT
ncbi:MAG: nicotinamide-nucleotide amidohydrolase family protein [Spirochaetaceae bacterium]|jgi:PncC family amidohydrolase|nr:nicotinamide-nucleotide amidohydrolase family protein [Spirochaetaceae bacterium]